MKTIKYKIEFYSDWHCGSGLSAGPDVDQLVVKDEDGMPFVPGKTIKGLIREAVEGYCQFSGNKNEDEIERAFGVEASKDKEMTEGTLYFSNAVLSEKEHRQIVEAKAQKYMYRKIASTRIDEDGIAVNHSLRKMEVTVPCTLEGNITGADEEMEKTIKKGLKMIKRMGQNRNRGLGRCDIKVEE